jgi:glutamine amidotransferase
MCRFLGYLGPPVTLASIVLDPPDSLRRQAWAPRHQRAGAVNADGFGVGWYDLDRRAEPARYRTTRPIWSDRSFASLAGLVASPAVLAALRDATPPAPIEESGTPPFTAGRWLFAHNGAVDGYGTDQSIRIRLRRLVPDEEAAGIEGAADSELLFALALGPLRAGAGLAEALASVVPAVLGVTGARLNMVVTDGRELAATSCGDSLFVLEGDGRVVVASEPYDDDPAWRPVPEGSMVEAGPERVTIGAVHA